MSDSECHILELIDRARIHDIEIVFPWREVFWDLDPCHLIVYDLELRILEYQVVTELDGYNLVEAIPLYDDEFIGIIGEGFWCDIRDIYRRIRMLKGETNIGCENLSIFEREEYEILSGGEGVSVHLYEEHTAPIRRMNTLLSDIYELYRIKILSMKSEEIVDIRVVLCLVNSYKGRICLWNCSSCIRSRYILHDICFRSRCDFWLNQSIIRTEFPSLSCDLQERGVLYVNALQICFLNFSIVQEYVFYVERVFDS